MHHSRRSIFTMSDSAVSLRSRVRVPGLFTSSSHSTPERGGRRSAGRRQPWYWSRWGKARLLTLARRGPSRATGRLPLGAPPWRCRPGTASIAGTACRLRREGSTQPGISAGRGTGLSCPRLRAAVDATSRSAIRIVSGGRPSMSETSQVCSIAAFRSQLLFEFRGGVVHIDADRTWVFSSKRPRQAAPVADPFRPRCPQRDDYVSNHAAVHAGDFVFV